MKIGMDCRRIMPGMSGLGSYNLQLLLAIAPLAQRSGHDITAFVTGDAREVISEQCDSVTFSPVRWPVEDHVRGEYWKHVILPDFLNRERFDVYHDPAYQLPLKRSTARYVVTIHDLAPFRHPETNTFKYNVYWRYMTRRAIQTAARIITVSEFIRCELEDMFGGVSDRIDVVPEAAAPFFCPKVPDPVCLSRLGIHGRYLLTTAKYEPRKNLLRCVKAFFSGPARQFPEVTLVVAGGMGWKNTQVQDLLSDPNIRDRVVLTGFLSQTDLVDVMCGAEAMVIPSIYEGFGLPVLEAMACGTPVICSQVASLPEVGGDAALYFDPYDVDAIGEAMVAVLGDDGLRRELGEKGLARSRQYSWSRAADATLAVYEKALG